MESLGLAGRIGVRAAKAGVAIDGRAMDALAGYVELLLRWNRRMNLTGLSDDDKGLDRLVVEPLVAAGILGGGVCSIVDIGSGGGSPAVPMKLAVPGLRLRMVEPRMRRGAFLREVVRVLCLEDVVVETCRYEELLRRPDLREAADVVTARAVRVETHLLEGLLKVGGRLLLFRGSAKVDVAGAVRPPMRWKATYPLVESSGSRLEVLQKT